MRWLKRIGAALLALVLVAAGLAAFLYWRTTKEPDFLAGARTVSPQEARTLVESIAARAAGPDPDTGTAAASPTAATATRPFRLELDEREVAAIVISRTPPAFAAAVADLRVRIRESDLALAGTIRQAPFEGQTAWIDVRPSVGAGGALCFALGRLHLGSADVPEALIREMTGGQGMPRAQCVSHRGLLPGPLTGVEVAPGRIVLRGVRGYTAQP